MIRYPMSEPKTLLVVEDESSLLNAIVDHFEREGYRMLKAINGEVGLTLALEHKPDLILLDILMPKKHGIDMVNELRAHDVGQHIPVILLSNLSDDPRANQIAKDKYAEYLVKSNVTLEEVARVVRDKLAELGSKD